MWGCTHPNTQGIEAGEDQKPKVYLDDIENLITTLATWDFVAKKKKNQFKSIWEVMACSQTARATQQSYRGMALDKSQSLQILVPVCLL